MKRLSTLILSFLNLHTLVLGLSVESSNPWNQVLEVHQDASTCHVQLVESIPQGLVYNESMTNMLTFRAWQSLLEATTESLHLASSYWSLRGKDVFEHPSDWQGEWIFEALHNLAVEKKIPIHIAQNKQANNDTDELGKIDGIEVRTLDFDRLMGAGILHTKLWISDKRHFYVGSANFDWRSLTQVKELGVLAMNCPELAGDMEKIFQVYWYLGQPEATIPNQWPQDLQTTINFDNPLPVMDTSVFLSSSPPPFCPGGREVDIEAISKVISSAQEFIHIAVMDYSPSFLYDSKHEFWPVIDNLLRQAVIERGVKVKLLFSLWDHTKANMFAFMKSLSALDGLENADVKARLFKVPAFSPDQAEIPFARVNHNKYMVTDQHGFIGTSNWSADYFVNTGGIGFVFDKSQLQQELQALFQRDWTSSYAQEL